ncbi:MAG: dehydrogenase [Alphaproteobacteria bacterium]|nr:dehydrogenase [Alphaproteobacteria bacterium]
MSPLDHIRVACIGFVFDTVAQAIMRDIAPPGFALSFAERPQEQTDEGLAACDVIMTVAPVTEAMMLKAPRLRLIQKWGIGVDKIDLTAAERHGIHVAITAGANADTIAEHTILLMLAVLRRLVVADRAVRAGRWIPAEIRPQSRKLAGKTVGIVGFGNIGRAVARQLQGFATQILYHDARGPLDAGTPAGATYVALEDLLVRSDILTLHVPGGDANRHLLDKAALARMKRGAVIINSARGNLIHENDLADALESGQLSGAGLDVFETEPLGADSRLRQFDNVVLTPHSAGSVMDDVAPMAAHCFANIQRFLRGEAIAAADVIVRPARPRILS